MYDQWIAPPATGQRPKARYEHGAAVVQDKIEAKAGAESLESPSPVTFAPCAGHSLIPWENKLLSIAGHTKDPAESIQVRAFDLQSNTWSPLKTYGKAPVSRGGQSVTLFGTSLVIFGGQDAKRTLLNDLHILHLETLTWDEIDAVSTVNFVLCLLMKPLLHLLEVAKLGPSTSYSSVYHIDYIITHTAR
ncbi:hypothetical protein ACB092_08G065900 [Castanea dentata]